MPTHRDLPDGFDEAAARRRAEVDDAERRARDRRSELAQAELPLPAELQAIDAKRRATSVPPPGWTERS
jgi:hypothetical protein